MSYLLPSSSRWIPDNEGDLAFLGIPTPWQLAKNIARTQARWVWGQTLTVTNFLARNDKLPTTTSAALTTAANIALTGGRCAQTATNSTARAALKTAMVAGVGTVAVVGGVAAAGYMAGGATKDAVVSSHRQLFQHLDGDNGVDEDCAAIEQQTDTDVDHDMPCGVPNAPVYDDLRPGGKRHLRRRKIKRFVNAVKAKYPNLIEHDNEATRASVHRYINRKMQEKGMRPSQIVVSLPIVLELAFVPTPVEIYASKIRKSRHKRIRVANHRNPPGPFRQAVHDCVERLGPGLARWIGRRMFESGAPEHSPPRDF